MLELMLAMSVAALVGAATVGMLNAVSVGVDSRYDHRTATIRAHHAQTRINAYVSPSRCMLHHDSNAIVLWLDDSRKNNAVNISEVRWLTYDAGDGELTAHFVTFPEWMTDLHYAIYDRTYPASSDWMDLLDDYRSHPQLNIGSTKLIDGLTTFTSQLDVGDAIDAQHVTFNLSFETRRGEFTTISAATIRRHQQPQE